MTFKEFFQENYGGHSYSCLMLDCSDLSDEVAKLQEKIETSDLLENRTKSIERQIHITILYGLLTNSAKKVLDTIPKKPINYKIKGISLFESEEQDVLKFDIESEDLKKLNKKVSNAFENENSYPVYHAHMTIAYLKPGKGKKYLKLKSPLIGMELSSSVLEFSSRTDKRTFRVLKESPDK